MSEILRGPGTWFDYNVRGVKYEVVQGGAVYSEYTGDGKAEKNIETPPFGIFSIREKSNQPNRAER